MALPSANYWHDRGYTLVTDVLAELGLPADTLETTGLVYLWEPYRCRSFRWMRLAHSAKEHLFPEFGGDHRYVVKRGHEAAFRSQLKHILAGKEKVETYAPHVVRMRAIHERKRAERTARHATRMAELEAVMPRRKRQPTAEELELAALFLEKWELAGRDPNKHPNHIPTRTIIYANGPQSLLDTGVEAWARERIIVKLRPGQFVGRAYKGKDLLSGTWTFERFLITERKQVRIVLSLQPGEPPRCEQFGVVGPGLQAPPEPGLLEIAPPSSEWVELVVDGARCRTWHLVVHDRRTGIPYGTRPQDQATITRARNMLRVKRGLPFPEDFVRFREQYGSMYTEIDDRHVSSALGWPPDRWSELENGAMATEEEAAIMLRLDEPRWLYEQLERDYPEVYHLARPGVRDPVGKQELGRWAWREERMFLTDPPPDLISGFARRDVDWISELANMLGWRLSPSVQEFWLMLFLCDMKHYAMFGQGFTGNRYRASSRGPQVEGGEALLARLKKAQAVSVSRRKYKGVEAQRIYSHSFFHPVHLTANWRSDDLLEALGSDRETWDPAMVMRACQRAPEWDEWAAKGAWIPYDIASYMQL